MLRTIFAAAAMALFASSATAQEAQPRITVTGQAEAAAPPDMAVFDIGVTRADPDAAAAMDQVSDAVRTLLDRLTDADVAARDVQTTGLSLYPRFDDMREPGQQPEIAGYVAENRVTVRVRDMERLGELLQEMLRDGANTLGQIRFTLSDPKALIAQARRDAVADARARADVLADAAGVRLGPVLSIEEGGAMSAPNPMMRMVATEDAMPVAGGEVARSVSVTIVYAISGAD